MPRRTKWSYLDFGQFSIDNLKNVDSPDMNVDGSVTPVEFTFSPPDGFQKVVGVFTATMSDNQVMNADEFGGGAALTNGFRFIVKRNGVETIDLLGGGTVKRNIDFGLFAEVDGILSNRGLVARWNVLQSSCG